MLDAIATEQWCEYGIGVSIFIFRFFARWKIGGFRNFAADDICAFIALIFWTGETVTVNLLGHYGTYVGLTKETAETLDAHTIEEYTKGSKALFVAWVCYATLIWSLKATVLFFYNRMTTGLSQHQLVRYLALACGIGYMVVMLELFLHCTPIQRNWQIKPYAGDQCTLYYGNYYTITIINVLTDGGILCFIPIPILWKVRIPLRRKLWVGLLLCSGIFVISAAVIRCVLSVTEIRSINTSGVWAIRETFVTILAINAPVIKPIFDRSAWIRQGGSDKTKAYGSNSMRSRKNVIELQSRSPSENPRSEERWDTGSEDHIISKANASNDLETGKSDQGMKINVTKMYDVKSDSKSEVELPTRW